MDQKNDHMSEKTKQKILLVQKEYELVANKVTALSMSFIKGTYIVPISLIVAIVSTYFSKETYVVDVFLAVLPLLLNLYGYNHIRYMVLQMKAGEYCSHLEETLNKYYDGEEILLWENKLARDSNQTLFEGAFFTMVYGINFILIYVIGYSSIIKSVFNGVLRDEIAIGIIISYYAAILFSLLFLVIFGSVATKKIRKKINLDRGNAEETRKSSCNERRFRKRIMMLLLTIVLFAPTALMPLIYYFQKSNTQEAKNINWDSVDTIIVLGNKLENGNLSKEGMLRMNELIYHLNNDVNSDVRIILSGGKGEARAMKQYFENFGIKAKVECENDSKTTLQNLDMTKDMVDGDTVIITSDYHVFRTHMLLRKLELNYKIDPVMTDRLKYINMWKECYKLFGSML